MKSSLFPDVNVWLALTHSRHAQHSIAARWFQENEAPLYFCRFTQLGLLRLLTSEQVMGVDVMNQRKAWQVYLGWFEDVRVEFHREPEGAEFERWFQTLSTRPHPSPKLWADAYLAAFARTAGLTILTFDQGFHAMSSVEARILSTRQTEQRGS